MSDCAPDPPYGRLAAHRRSPAQSHRSGHPWPPAKRSLTRWRRSLVTAESELLTWFDLNNPSGCPSQRRWSPVWCSNQVCDLGGAMGIRTPDLLHAMNPRSYRWVAQMDQTWPPSQGVRCGRPGRRGRSGQPASRCARCRWAGRACREDVAFDPGSR